MGILVANLPAYALPHAAYFSPLAWGGTKLPDLIAWFITYVLVEGKMRGLLTFLFGASMLAMIDQARGSWGSVALAHAMRMLSLGVIGLVHLYLFWWGDILQHYAMVGAIAFIFHRLSARDLLLCGLLALLLQLTIDSYLMMSCFDSIAQNTPERLEQWNLYNAIFGVPGKADLAGEIAEARGHFVATAWGRWAHETNPLIIVVVLGFQTLSSMLFGMAAYRAGFLTGTWDRPRYRKWARICIGISLPLYTAIAINTWVKGFSPPWVLFGSIFAAEVLRPVMVSGYAALLILVMKSDGRITTRVAAVGRSALTNYLGTTLFMTFIFSGWGLGQFGLWSRAQLYLLVPVAWLMMLAWSKPWLARFQYGPFERIWRSASRLPSSNATTVQGRHWDPAP